MSPELVSEIYRNALTVTIVMSAPVLTVALAVGTTISVLQAATQVNEMTLSFVPKALAAAGTLWATSGWLIEQWLTYVQQLYALIEVAPTTM